MGVRPCVGQRGRVAQPLNHCNTLPYFLPVRSDALASAPKAGEAHRRIPPNKKTYQQDPANFREVSGHPHS